MQIWAKVTNRAATFKRALSTLTRRSVSRVAQAPPTIISGLALAVSSLAFAVSLTQFYWANVRVASSLSLLVHTLAVDVSQSESDQTYDMSIGAMLFNNGNRPASLLAVHVVSFDDRREKACDGVPTTQVWLNHTNLMVSFSGEAAWTIHTFNFQPQIVKPGDIGSFEGLANEVRASSMNQACLVFVAADSTAKIHVKVLPSGLIGGLQQGGTHHVTRKVNLF